MEDFKEALSKHGHTLKYYAEDDYGDSGGEAAKAALQWVSVHLETLWD
tara:strand:- start:154 stop:297 length:144 start_codon:yes stop_codon:yes gene_type:complete